MWQTPYCRLVRPEYWLALYRNVSLPLARAVSSLVSTYLSLSVVFLLTYILQFFFGKMCWLVSHEASDTCQGITNHKQWWTKKMWISCSLECTSCFISHNKTNIIWKHTCPMLTEALFTTARTWRQPKCPRQSYGWRRLLHIHSGIHSAVKKNGISHCSNMGGPIDCHTEGSKLDRVRQIS